MPTRASLPSCSRALSTNRVRAEAVRFAIALNHENPEICHARDPGRSPTGHDGCPRHRGTCPPWRSPRGLTIQMGDGLAAPTVGTPDALGVVRDLPAAVAAGTFHPPVALTVMNPARPPGGEPDRSCPDARIVPRGGRLPDRAGRAARDGRRAARRSAPSRICHFACQWPVSTSCHRVSGGRHSWSCSRGKRDARPRSVTEPAGA